MYLFIFNNLGTCKNTRCCYCGCCNANFILDRSKKNLLTAVVAKSNKYFKLPRLFVLSIVSKELSKAIFQSYNSLKLRHCVSCASLNKEVRFNHLHTFAYKSWTTHAYRNRTDVERSLTICFILLHRTVGKRYLLRTGKSSIFYRISETSHFRTK